jgi:alpha-galactosidase
MMGVLDWEQRRSSMLKAFSVVVVLLAASLATSAQPAVASFDAASKVFRLDGGRVSYVFGVNEKGELQQLYWGGRLGTADVFPKARAISEWASFDSSNTTTPQEYAGLGGGLFVEPALKVSFADGKRRTGSTWFSRTSSAGFT